MSLKEKGIVEAQLILDIALIGESGADMRAAGTTDLKEYFLPKWLNIKEENVNQCYFYESNVGSGSFDRMHVNISGDIDVVDFHLAGAKDLREFILPDKMNVRAVDITFCNIYYLNENGLRLYGDKDNN